MVLIMAAGLPAVCPSWNGFFDVPWSLDVFWKTWEMKLAAFFWSLGVVLGLMGWVESFRVFLFGRDRAGEPAALCFGISLIGVSLFVFGLGVNGIFFSPLMALFFLIRIPAGFSIISKVSLGAWTSLQKSFLVLSLVPWLFEYLSPPIIWDAILDHFRFCEEVARLHQIPFHWVNHTGDIPKGAELLGAAFWSLGGETLARLLSALAFAGILYLGILIARRLQVPRWPVVLILVACPFWMALFSWGYDEGLLALYEVLALLGLIYASREDGHPAGFGVCFFFLGAALGVKYTALFAWVGIAAVFFYRIVFERQKFRLDWRWALFALIPCFPWLLRNELANGNPFYPMATAWFGGPPSYSPALETDLWADTGRGPGGFRILEAFKTVFIDFTTSRNQVGALLAPLLLMGIPLWIRLRKFTEAKALFVFSVVFLSCWIIFCTDLRHAAGGLLALALLSGLAWSLVFKTSPKLVRWVFVLGLLFSIGMVWVTQLNVTKPYGCGLGLQDPLVRLKRNYDMNFDTFSAYETVEKSSAPLDKTLAFAVYQTYPLRRTAFVDFFWKKPIFLNWASQCKTAEQLAQRLRQEGVTYFIYQRMEAAFMSRKEKDFVLSGMTPSEYVRFWRIYTEPVGVFENSSVYRIRTQSLVEPRNLTDLPGLEEPLAAKMFEAEQKGQWPLAYRAAIDLTRFQPQLGFGWERRSYYAGQLNQWKEAVESGDRAEGLGGESLDLCDTMVSGWAHLGQPAREAAWIEKRSNRSRWLEGLRRESLSFEEE
jgi:hypothetical protein